MSTEGPQVPSGRTELLTLELKSEGQYRLLKAIMQYGTTVAIEELDGDERNLDVARAIEDLHAQVEDADVEFC